VAIDGQGRIVLAGVRLRGGDAQDSATVCVIRLLPDGRPDPSFSRNGVALVDHGYGNDSAEAVVLRGGKVIVAGDGRDAGGSRFGLARLRGDGRLDRSFGRRGHRLVSFGARRVATAYALTAAPDGRIVAVGGAVAGGRRPQFAIARRGRRGRLERRVRTGTGEDTAEAIALTPGHATIAGSIYSSHGLARYLTR
jgi:uncharacterized delta-60 repeat protein